MLVPTFHKVASVLGFSPPSPEFSTEVPSLSSDLSPSPRRRGKEVAAMADGKKLSAPAPPPRLQSLFKQKSWSPDSDREEAWERRKGLYRTRRKETAGGGEGGAHRLSRSVTDEDLEELQGCIDLGFGFGFDSPASSTTASSLDDLDRLSDTLPALDLYYAVQRSYSDALTAQSPAESPLSSIFSPGDNPQQVKRRLKQWAQVVACTLRPSLRRPLQQELKEGNANNEEEEEEEQ